MNESACSNAFAGTGRCSLRSLREAEINDQPVAAVDVNRISMGIHQETYRFPAASDLGTFPESNLTSSLSTPTSRVCPSLLYSNGDDYDDEILMLARDLHRAVLSLEPRRNKGRTQVAEPHHDDPHSQLSYSSCHTEIQISLLCYLRSLDEMLERDRRNHNDECLDDEQSLGDSTVDSLVYYRMREQKATRKNVL